jgi:hypothetical protein
MEKTNLVFLLVSIFLTISPARAQDAKIVGNKIIGTWLNKDDATDKYIFQSNQNSLYYYGSSNKPFRYKYTITNDPSTCEPEIKKRPGDTATYIRLYDIKEKSVSCFVINGITRKMLSL